MIAQRRRRELKEIFAKIKFETFANLFTRIVIEIFAVRYCKNPLFQSASFKSTNLGRFRNEINQKLDSPLR